MIVRIALLPLALVGLAAAGNPAKVGEGRGENESVVIKATVYSTPEAVKEILGTDLGGYYVVVAVDLNPRFGKEVVISRDDFVLKTDKNGEKTTPFAPSQIAGRGALVVSSRGGGGGAMRNNNGPILGGIPGTGTVPHRTGGDGDTYGGAPQPDTASARSRAKAGDSSLVKLLEEKALPEAKTDHPVSGLLYFPMDKQKPKDLELRYNAVSDDKLVMRFHQER